MIPVIISGGVGARLWPVSREQHPKPFIRLSDGQSLLQKAYLRAVALPSVTEVMTVTNRELFFKSQDEYAEVAAEGVALTYVLEPFGRNTAAAIAAAALDVCERHGAQELVLVLPADHLINTREGFVRGVARATVLAEAGKLVTFGIRPESPETGYGYIQAEGEEVVRFVEKPDSAKAREYVDSDQYLWNAGMFCFAAGVMLEQMRLHCPEILEAVKACRARSARVQGDGLLQLVLDASSFALVPSDSIDYAVMERSAQVAVVPCDMGWSDIGSWSALGDLVAADDKGNRVVGTAVLHDTRDCTIQAGDRLVGAVGVDHLLIIDTTDALLVADRRKAQDVKFLFEAIKKSGHEAYRSHKTVNRPWGTYTVLEEAESFKIKRIEVKPGGRLSLQLHRHRSEHWVVVSGTAWVINGEVSKVLQTNESTYIPALTQHRLENRSSVALVMIEVQTGSYLGEDDIVRFADQYGREL